jgi:hypothetical protein
LVLVKSQPALSEIHRANRQEFTGPEQAELCNHKHCGLLPTSFSEREDAAEGERSDRHGPRNAQQKSPEEGLGAFDFTGIRRMK